MIGGQSCNFVVYRDKIFPFCKLTKLILNRMGKCALIVLLSFLQCVLLRKAFQYLNWMVAFIDFK